MTNQEPPKIEFPCPDYPIKVVGEAGASLRDHTIAVFTKHAADFNPERIKTKASSKGTWQSLTIAIEATGEDQLRAIFEDLKANTAVKMVI